MEISTGYSSTSLSFASVRSATNLSSPDIPSRTPVSTDRVSLSEEARHASLSAEAASLSVAGTISGKDAKEVGYALDLQYAHASYSAEAAELQAGPDGVSLAYAGTAAELSSTNLSFTMNSAAESGPAAAKGALQLNDEVSRIGKEVKPLVKDFMSEAGVRGGWGTVNRFLRSLG